MSTRFVLFRLLGSWLAACIPLSAVAQAPTSGNYGDWPGPWHMMWWGGWGFGWIFPLLMFAFMMAVCFFFMRAMCGRGDRHSSRDTTASALEILNERFAKGEISKEEFEERRSILTRRS